MRDRAGRGTAAAPGSRRDMCIPLFSGACAMLWEVGEHNLCPAVVGPPAQRGSEGRRVGGGQLPLQAIAPAAAATASNSTPPTMPSCNFKRAEAALTRAPAPPATPLAACSRRCSGAGRRGGGMKADMGGRRTREAAVRHLQHRSNDASIQCQVHSSEIPPPDKEQTFERINRTKSKT